jgi:hypothetical protein
MTLRRRSIVRTVATVGAAVAAAGLVGGCGGAGDQLAEQAAEAAAEAAGEDVDLDVDGDSVTIEAEGGSVTSTAGDELPEDFPADVPLLEGTLTFSQRLEVPDGTSWTALLELPGDVESSTAEAVAALEGAGFSIETQTTSESAGAASSFVSARRDDFLVQLTLTEAGGTVSAQYAIVEVPEG